MLEGKLLSFRGDMSKLEKLDDRDMKFKKAKSCCCEIISCKSTSWKLADWQSA